MNTREHASKHTDSTVDGPCRAAILSGEFIRSKKFLILGTITGLIVLSCKTRIISRFSLSRVLRPRVGIGFELPLGVDEPLLAVGDGDVSLLEPIDFLLRRSRLVALLRLLGPDGDCEPPDRTAFCSYRYQEERKVKLGR